MGSYTSLQGAIRGQFAVLDSDGETVDTGHWQGYETQGKPDLITTELVDVRFDAPIPDTVGSLADQCQPNLPWAEIEFQERVGGEPHNPHDSLDEWPWWVGQSATTMENGVFSHTYSERFWPKYADPGPSPEHGRANAGIRYTYGDLDDVIALLRKYPYTRQATFPIFFPEDTGAVHGGRIPCTLHYHFLLRHDKLHMWYAIRSCDAVRHFRDDVYMAARLCQWVIGEVSVAFEVWKMKEPRTMSLRNIWRDVTPGRLHFTAYSFHTFAGDKHYFAREASK